MAGPTTAIQRYDLSLTFNEFSMRLNAMGFIGLQVCPPTSVAKQSAQFTRLAQSATLMRLEDDVRAPKATYRRDETEWETDTYSTDEHGVEEVVDDREIEIYGSEFDAEALARNRAVARIAMNFEHGVADLLFNNWPGTSAAAGFAWSDKPNADPVADVDDAVDRVIAQCGTRPNALILDRVAWTQLVRTDRVEELVKYSGRMDPTEIARAIAQLQDLFQLEQIIIANTPHYNSAGKDQNPVLAPIWDPTIAMVALVGSGSLAGEVPYVAQTLISQVDGTPLPGASETEISTLVEEYREEPRRGGVIRARNNYERKLFYADAGTHITGVTA